MKSRLIAWIAVCAAATVCAPGCAFFVRASFGPVIAPDGETGFEAAVAVGFGPSDGASAVSTVIAGGGDDLAANLAIGLETSGKFDDHVAGHLGLGYRSRDAGSAQREDTLRGTSVRAGLGYALLREEKRSRWLVDRLRAIVVGMELEAGYLWGEGGGGLLGFPAYLEVYSAN